jgi:general secretion pathway protein B
MSFILDALRRSEHERQRQTGPALADAPVATPKARTNPWATAAIALLIVNLVAVGLLLLARSNREQAASVAPAAATPVAQAPQPATAAPITAAPPVPPGPDMTSAARTPPMLTPAGPASPAPGRNPLELEVVDDVPAVASETVARAARPPPGPPAVARAPGGGGTVVYQSLQEAGAVSPRAPETPHGNLPTAEELTARGGLPELKLDLHVYSTKPSERFVFINGSRYREGDTTREGAQVEEISREGVVMSLRGNRFLLPRE